MDKKLFINSREIPLSIDEENEIFKVGNIVLSSKEEFILFINKLTDIAEEMFNEI